jgi:hypothetical protein
MDRCACVWVTGTDGDTVIRLSLFCYLALSIPQPRCEHSRRSLLTIILLNYLDRRARVAGDFKYANSVAQRIDCIEVTKATSYRQAYVGRAREIVTHMGAFRMLPAHNGAVSSRVSPYSASLMCSGSLSKRMLQLDFLAAGYRTSPGNL